MAEQVKAPWLAFYGEVPATLTYSKETMSGEVRATGRKYTT